MALRIIIFSTAYQSYVIFPLSFCTLEELYTILETRTFAYHLNVYYIDRGQTFRPGRLY